jgi:membrane-bound lytic murein transglycosylase B
MKCRHCGSKHTKVVVTEHHGNETWRYCRCEKCDKTYKTIETYAIPKRGSVPGCKPHPNQVKRGEENHSAVLTENNIRTIRQLSKQHKTYQEIATQFGIHKDTVYKIVNLKSWKHVQ